tara:strand:- start:6692 stop:7063 length:372 start_codon:yes stop_codon:yes gene_type:complete
MRWRNSKRSSNVEDHRGQPGVRSSASTGLLVAQLFRFLPFLLKSKVGRVVLLGGVLFFGYQVLMGDGDLMGQIAGTPAVTQQSNNSANSQALTDENAQFVAAILGTTETVWGELLPNGYSEPT